MQFNPDNITREHVLAALTAIKSQNIELEPSTKWVVSIDGGTYPPKEIIRYARRELDGQMEWPYSGGDATNKYLEKLGFPVTEKGKQVDPQKGLLEKYKALLEKRGLQEEIYKWELLGQFKGWPDLDAPDFTNEINRVDFRNLVYPVGISVIRHIAKEYPEEYRHCFRRLVDENTSLEIRIKQFMTDTLGIYRRLVTDSKLSHHHDERTIATFLTYRFPERYSFYKDSFYRKFCQLLGQKPKTKGEKYLHYLELVRVFIDDYIVPDSDLLDMVQKQIPENTYRDPTHTLLAQDILYTILDKGIDEIELGCANILKISMGEFSDSEVQECIKKGIVLVYQHTKAKGQSSTTQGETFEKEIKIGDYFYLTHGNKAGAIKLLGRITGVAQSTQFDKYAEDDWLERSFISISPAKKSAKYTGVQKWWTPNDNSTCIQIRKDEVDEANKLLFEPYFGTAFISDVNEETKEDNSSYEKMKQPLNQILFGPPGTGKTYNTINRALQVIDDKEVRTLDWNDRKAIKELYGKKVSTGQIAFVTFHQIMSYEDFVEGIKPLKPERNQNGLMYDVEPGIFRIMCERAKEVRRSGSGTNWGKADYFKMSVGGKDRPDLHEWCLDNDVVALGWGGNTSLNEFKAISSWDTFRDKFTDRFPDLVKESRFHIQAAFAFMQMKKGDVVVISKGNHIVDAIGVVDGDYYFDDKSPVEYYHFRKVKWVTRKMNASPGVYLRKQISQQSIYQFDKEDIRLEAFKGLTDSDEMGIKPHVLIIDEINRGNISQIFGELITLIEKDKRAGMDESLEVMLPYSKTRFSVPSNLYIIGTMNTADRSVEALDTALRRRFSFEEMPPRYDLNELGYEYAGFKAFEILKKINCRIEKLVDKDHQVGHSFFIRQDGESPEQKLIDAFYRNIMPLLQEYFFGDFGKIGLVLGGGFVTLKLWGKENGEFAPFDHEAKEDFAEKPVYEVIDYRTGITHEIKDEPFNFERAIQYLMK
jgi:hypothetical protein